MEDPLERCVCDLSVIMRTRLYFGQFNKRSVSPRWRRCARIYCCFILIINILYSFVLFNMFRDPLYTIYYTSIGVQIIVTNFCCLFSADESIFIYFLKNKLTDITLDSPAIFKSLQKQMNQAYIFSAVYYATYVFLSSCAYYVNIFTLLLAVIPLALYEMVVACSFLTKLLVMALFNCRMLVLKRRMQRYGFRTFGQAQPQPYCQIFHEIWRMIEETDRSFKIMLFYDVVNSCGRFICMVLMCLYKWWWGHHPVAWVILYFTAWMFQLLMFSFGHVAMLESAAAHCEDMAVFTATQLIKNPTKEERQRMRDFLQVLEQRGAQYRVLRALPLDARLVLRALGFSTAQVFVFVNVVLSK